MIVIRVLHNTASACAQKLGRIARTGIVGAVIVCLLLVFRPALGQETVPPETAYAALVETTQQINLLLEEALELAGRGVGERLLEEQLAIAVNLVRVIEGSGEMTIDPVLKEYRLVGDGLAPLLERYNALVYRMDGAAGELILESLPLAATLYVNDLMVFRTTSSLTMALAAARSVSSMEGDTSEALQARQDAFRSAYAHVLSMRGWKSDPNLVAGFLILADLLVPMELTVGPDDSIQAAIDRIPVGGTIYLEPGIYKETVAIEKSLTLVGTGQGETILQGVAWRASVTIMGQAPIDVSVSNLTFVGGAGGVMVVGEAHVSLDLLEFQKTTGVVAAASAYVICDACQFSECDGAVTVVDEAHLELRAECRISGTPSGNIAAVFVSNTANLRISDCTIESNATNGIFLQGGVGLHITDSVIRNNEGYGIGFCHPFPGLQMEEERNEPYDGTVTGSGNIIPGTDEEDPNLRGAVCPDSLDFLTEPLSEE